MTALHQIYYDEKQRPKLLPYSIPYKNEGLTIFFENDCIVKVIEASKAYQVDKIGVCSWKLADKMRRLHLENLHTKKDSDYQVLSLTRNSYRHDMLAFGRQWHNNFQPTMELLWKKLGLPMPNSAKHPIYQNHYLAKTEIYRDYVENFLRPAMELSETDEELRIAMRQRTKYHEQNRHADIRSVKQKLGLDYYPLAPFILERCPSLWFTMKHINVTYL